MPPKASKGMASKAVDSDAEADKIDLVEMWKKHVVFAPTLDMNTLMERYMCMWGRKTRAHSATRVLPASVKGSPDKFPFFAAYFYCGLCPPFLISLSTSCTHTASISWILRRTP
jgi:hypothetical protein